MPIPIPVPLLVIGGIALFLLLLLFLPVHLTVTYKDTVMLRLRVLCFSFRLFPKKSKLPKADKRKKAPRIAKKHKKGSKRVKKSKGEATSNAPAEKPTLTENLQLVRALVAALFRKTGKHLRLRASRLRIAVATGDAAKTAILYGAASAALAALLEGLERITRLRTAKEDVLIVADYLGERPSADVKLVFSLSLFGALSTLLSTALAYLSYRKKRARKPRNAAPAAGGAPSANTTDTTAPISTHD